MAPTVDDLDHAWDDSDLFGDDDIPEVHDSWTLEDIPEPPDSWTLQDLVDLLPDELD